MKRIILFCLVLLVLPLVVKADPAKKVNLTYNDVTKKLKIEAIHPVNNPDKHYIDQIIIYVNDKEVRVMDLKKQSDKKAEIVEVEVPQIVNGCEIIVKTRCNEFGTKKGTLKYK